MNVRTVLALSILMAGLGMATLLSGCGSPCDCIPRTVRQVAPDEPTRLGFTAAQFANSVSGHFSGTVNWRPSEDVSLTAQGTTSVELALNCEVGGGREVEQGGFTLELDCTAQIVTADGSIDEIVPVIVTTRPEDSPTPRLGEGTTWVSLDPATMKGTLRASPSAEYTAGPPSWDFSFQQDTVTGQLWFSAGREESDGSRFSWGCTIADAFATRDR